MNRILFVDDDRNLCALMACSARREGLAADCCYSGRESLHQLVQTEYQLVVLDVMMPSADGLETIAQIRKESIIPILMLTAKNDAMPKIQGLRAGADDCMTKPFDVEELMARIESLLQRYTHFDRLEKNISRLEYEGLTLDLDARSITAKQNRRMRRRAAKEKHRQENFPATKSVAIGQRFCF